MLTPDEEIESRTSGPEMPSCANCEWPWEDHSESGACPEGIEYFYQPVTAEDQEEERP